MLEFMCYGYMCSIFVLQTEEDRNINHQTLKTECLFTLCTFQYSLIMRTDNPCKPYDAS